MAVSAVVAAAAATTYSAVQSSKAAKAQANAATQAQATAEQVPVALLSMGITDCGQIKTTGLAIEPEHALIFLAELESVSVRLRAFVEAKRAPTALPADILPFERRA